MEPLYVASHYHLEMGSSIGVGAALLDPWSQIPSPRGLWILWFLGCYGYGRLGHGPSRPLSDRCSLWPWEPFGVGRHGSVYRGTRWAMELWDGGRQRY